MNYTLEHVKYKLIVTWPTTVSKSLPSTLNSSCWTEFKFFVGFLCSTAGISKNHY